MFFTASKILWFFAQPANLLLVALCLIAVLIWTRWWRLARALAVVTAVMALLVATLPVGQAVIQVIENRFPVPTSLPGKIDGLIVLGGAISPMLSKSRGQPQVNDAVERLMSAAALARTHPEARIIFSGGAGDLFNPELKEAHYAPTVFEQMGLESDRVVFEAESRNTAENAALTLEIAKPKAGETWLLITSAFHMPRAVGSFRKVGWRVIPYPVDFKTTGTAEISPMFSLSGGLGGLSHALHECLGLLFYWLTDRTETLFPGPGVRPNVE